MRATDFNSHKLLRVMKAQRRLFVLVTAVLSALLLVFAFQWQQALERDLTYFVTSEGTFPARQRAQKTDLLEVEHFTRLFLHYALAHSEYTCKEPLNAALLLMDRKSGLYLKSKFTEETIEELYRRYNGVSTLDIDKIEINLEAYPYEVAAYYKTKLRFVGLNEEQGEELAGGVYFQLTHVPRSRENPYGLMMSQFNFIAYEQPE